MYVGNSFGAAVGNLQYNGVLTNDRKEMIGKNGPMIATMPFKKTSSIDRISWSVASRIDLSGSAPPVYTGFGLDFEIKIWAWCGQLHIDSNRNNWLYPIMTTNDISSSVIIPYDQTCGCIDIPNIGWNTTRPAIAVSIKPLGGKGHTGYTFSTTTPISSGITGYANWEEAKNLSWTGGRITVSIPYKILAV
tara:strand:- start:27 stop:599 length:573 start_codon:yes stop_codon:yes gene_type:complete